MLEYIKNIFNEITIENVDHKLIAIDKSIYRELSNRAKKFLKSKIKNSSIDDKIIATRIWSIWDPNDAIKYIKEKGYIRYCNYDLSSNVCEKIINCLLSDENIKKSEFYNYLLMKKYSIFYSSYKCLHSKIKSLIIKHSTEKERFEVNGIINESNLLLELIAYVEHKLETMDFKEMAYVPIKNLDFNDINSFPGVAILPGISYISYLYFEMYGSINNNQCINPRYVVSKDIKKLILLASQFVKLKEYEYLIDVYDYELTQNNKYSYTLSCRKSNLEKVWSIFAWQMSLITKDSMAQFEYKLKQEGAVSLYDLVNEYIKNIEIRDLYVNSKISLKVLYPLFEKLKWEDFLYMEEAVDSISFYYENTLPEYMFNEFEVFEGCTIENIITFKRFCITFSIAMYEFNNPPKYIFLVPSISIDEFREVMEIMTNCSLDINSFLNHMILNNSQMFDVIYRPLLKSNDTIYIPLNIVSTTKIERNIIAKEQLENNPKVIYGDDSRLIDECIALFNSVDCTIKDRVKLNNCGEIDLMVYKDNHLILIECKAPLQPSSIYELRKCIDYIKKGEQQLEKALQLFNNIEYLKNVMSNNGLNFDETNYKISSCILLGNNSISGIDIINYPVIDIFELRKLINHGIILDYYDKDMKRNKTWKTWQGNEFQISDFINFINSDHSITNARLYALESSLASLTIKGKTIHHEIFGTKSQRLLDYFNQYYTETK